MTEWKIKDDGTASRTDYGLGAAGDRGMMTLRSPKRRASSEKAPGPRRPDATATMIAARVGGWKLKTFQFAVGSHENMMPSPPRAARLLATGVRNPNRSVAPLTIASRQTNQISSLSSRT